ncbi:MAG: sulfite exporter TauE/SafE family protein [Geminicoccaceae bacterium]|nr:sulfite exporter TauE/SafE family protein [Geminicoccaceae bacterium]HRY23586.1 sulfite exporter TauE/SafE family protein [Geminicoccaceae bacterium]
MLLLGGALIAGFVSGFAGFGTGLVASGFWFVALPATSVPPMIVFTSVIAQLMALHRLRQSFDWRGVSPYLAGGVLGLPFGIMALQVASASLLRVTVGIFLVAYALVQLSAIRNWSVGTWGGWRADMAIGGGGGFLGGFAGLSGPLPLIWLQLRGGPSTRQRMTYQPFNLIILALAGLGMLLAGQIDGSVVRAVAWCLPVTVLGTWIGLRLYSAAGEALFKRIVLILLLISGGILVTQSITALH